MNNNQPSSNRPFGSQPTAQPLPQEMYQAPVPVAPRRVFTAPRILLIVAAIILPLLLAAGAYYLKENPSDPQLDADAKAKPSLVQGTGAFFKVENSDEISENSYSVSTNGVVAYLNQEIYYGLTTDAKVTSSSDNFFFQVAYLPNSKQAVEVNVYDKQGGTLLARYLQIPDAQDGYKAALYDRYNHDGTLLLLAAILAVTVWIGMAWLIIAVWLKRN